MKNNMIKILLVSIIVIIIAVLMVLVFSHNNQKIENNKYAILQIEAPYVNYPPVPNGFSHVEGTDVENGYVIQDVLGNEFVWIPIDGINIMQERKNYVGDTNLDVCTESLPSEIQSSIDEYKGFWIGRYEASSEGVSKRNVLPLSNVTKEQAISNCESYDAGSNASAHLIYGIEYDMAIQFIESVNSGYASNSITGNYGDALLQTGTSNDIQQNIYDMAGNLREWTMETKTSNGAGIIRGGSYNNVLAARI